LIEFVLNNNNDKDGLGKRFNLFDIGLCGLDSGKPIIRIGITDFAILQTTTTIYQIQTIKLD